VPAAQRDAARAMADQGEGGGHVGEERRRYMHMIRFFFSGIFDHDALADAAFVMRMDCDSELLAPLPNVFAMLESRSASYLALACAALLCVIPGRRSHRPPTPQPHPL